MILLRLVFSMVMFLVVSCKVQNSLPYEEKIVHNNEGCDRACFKEPCDCDEDEPEKDGEPHCFSERKTFVSIFDDIPGRCKDGKYIGTLPAIDPSCSESIRFETNCEVHTGIGDVVSVGEYSIVDTTLSVEDENYSRIFTIIDERTIENSEDQKLWKISK